MEGITLASVGFERLEDFDAEQLLNQDLEALIEFDAARLLRTLRAKLFRLVEIHHDSADSSSSIWSGSLRWCRDLARESPRGYDDIRAPVARALARVAVALALKSEADAREMWRLLSEVKGAAAGEIAARIRHYALARCAPHLAERVDDLLTEPESLSWSVPRSEIGDVLRMRFLDATPRAQQLFCYIVERGPDPQALELYLEQEASAGKTTGSHLEAEPPCATEPMPAQPEPTLSSAAIQAAVARWQRKVLRRFGASLPAILAPLAQRLGVGSAPLTDKERALLEIGSWSEPASFEGHRSPITPDEFAQMSAPDALKYLADVASRTDTEASDREGMYDALTRAVRAHPAWGASVAAVARAEQASPGVTYSLLSGFVQLASNPEERALIPWTSVVPLVRYVAERAELDARSRHDQAADEDVPFCAPPLSQSAFGTGMRLLADYLDTSAMRSVAREIWALLDYALGLRVTWSAQSLPYGAQESERVMLIAINVPAGRLVQAIVSAALAERAIRQGSVTAEASDDDATIEPADVPPDPLVGAMLDRVMTHVPREGVSSASRATAELGALAMLGTLAPQIELVAHDWLAEVAPRLFESPAEDRSGLSPAWIAYISRNPCYDSVFELLRAYYERAARALPGEVREGGRSAIQNVTLHVMTAVLRGRAELGDPDQLVEVTFSRSPIADRVHAYWAVYRGMKDSKKGVSHAFLQRILAFWRWRIQVLETSPQPEAAPTQQLGKQGEESEAEGLLWFFLSDAIPAEDAVELGLATVRLEQRSGRMRLPVFERLAELAADFPDRAFEMGDVVIRRALAGQFGYVPFEQVAPILRDVLRRGEPVNRERARRLVHELGHRGLTQFGQLLDQTDLGAEDPLGL